MPSLDSTQTRLDSPIKLILVGVFLGALGAAATRTPDAPAPFLLGCWLAVGIGGVIAQIGVVAAGVEYGLRRVRES